MICFNCLHAEVCEIRISAECQCAANYRVLDGCDHYYGWISVVDNLPDKNIKCLVRYGFNDDMNLSFFLVSDYYATDTRPHFQCDGFCGMRITHWMPLPEPPEG